MFFDIRVPKINIVGAGDKGWQVAKYLLEVERGGSTGGKARKVALQRVRKLAESIALDGGTVAEDPSLSAAWKRLKYS